MRVLRVNPHSYFKEDNEQPIYGAPSEALEGMLSGAVETSRRAWWIECRSGGATTFQRQYVYKVWEVALNWLARLSPTIDELLPELNAGNILVELDLSAIASNERWEADAIANLSDISECPVSAGDRVMRIVVPVEFLKELGQVRNIAERRLIDALVIGAIGLASVSDRAVRYQRIMTELAVSDDQRYMHAFRVDDARDHLREFDSGQPHLLEIEDVAPGSLAVAGEAGLPYPSSITGKDKCNLALNQLVDAYWARCSECLKLLNRASVVSWCLLNQERALCELDEWRRTSRAVMALHRDREDVLRASQVRRAARDRTQTTNRVAVEMAICTSPVDSGRTTSQGDLDYLCGQIAHLISAANQSDAVRAGAEDPILEISALGEVDFRGNLESLVTPYFASAFEKEHMGDVRNYEEFFEDKEHGTKTDEQVFGEEFVDAFQTEFGISPGRLALLGVALTEDAVKLESIVVQKTQKSFKELMEEQGFTNDEINGFFRSFVSNPRERWNSARRPFRGKDWWPWRFNRRLSLMTRPVVAITDVALIYAPGFCEDSFRHVVMSCFKGSFETEYFDSVAMREYVGRENARRGHEFNEAVGDIFRKAGWSARTEVQMSELGAPEEAASGDIDVLAWKDGVVCVCECKELWFARTIGQIVEQLSRFRGREGDDLFKHLRRAEWVRANPGCLSRVIGSSAFQMRSLLITSKIVPMQFVSGLDVEVIDADRLPELI